MNCELNLLAEVCRNFELLLASVDVFVPVILVALVIFASVILLARSETTEMLPVVALGFNNGVFFAYLWVRDLLTVPVQLSMVFVFVGVPLIGVLKGKLSMRSGTVAVGSMSISFVCFAEYFLKVLPAGIDH